MKRLQIMYRAFRPALLIAANIFALALILSFTASAYYLIDSMDTGAGWDNSTPVNGSVVEGGGAIFSSSDTLLVTSRVLDAPIDLSEIENGGYLHVWVYIEDASKLTGNGQLELTSSGTCDVEETSWGLTTSLFKNGWNELLLSIYNTDQDAADLTKINYIRFYEFTDGSNSWMIDEIAIGQRSDFVSDGSETIAAEDDEDEETLKVDDSIGGFVQKNNNTAAGNGPINKYMYYVIIVLSVLNIGAVAIITKVKKP